MLQERDILNDLLKDARFLITCETFCSVEASPQLKPTFLDVIREDQDIHTRLFQFALSRGWYATLWGDMGFQQPAAGYGAQQAWGGYGQQALAQPGTWLQPQAQPAWQQPAAQSAWQQPQNVAGLAASPITGARYGQAGSQASTGTIEVAGREYGPY